MLYIYIYIIIIIYLQVNIIVHSYKNEFLEKRINYKQRFTATFVHTKLMCHTYSLTHPSISLLMRLSTKNRGSTENVDNARAGNSCSSSSQSSSIAGKATQYAPMKGIAPAMLASTAYIQKNIRNSILLLLL